MHFGTHLLHDVRHKTQVVLDEHVARLKVARSEAFQIRLFLGGGERARERAGIAGKAQGEKQAVAQKSNGSGKHIHQLLPSPYVGAGSPYAYALRRRPPLSFPITSCAYGE